MEDIWKTLRSFKRQQGTRNPFPKGNYQDSVLFLGIWM